MLGPFISPLCACFIEPENFTSRFENLNFGGRFPALYLIHADKILFIPNS